MPPEVVPDNNRWLKETGSSIFVDRPVARHMEHLSPGLMPAWRLVLLAWRRPFRGPLLRLAGLVSTRWSRHPEWVSPDLGSGRPAHPAAGHRPVLRVAGAVRPLSPRAARQLLAFQWGSSPLWPRRSGGFVLNIDLDTVFVTVLAGVVGCLPDTTVCLHWRRPWGLFLTGSYRDWVAGPGNLGGQGTGGGAPHLLVQGGGGRQAWASLLPCHQSGTTVAVPPGVLGWRGQGTGRAVQSTVRNLKYKTSSLNLEFFININYILKIRTSIQKYSRVENSIIILSRWGWVGGLSFQIRGMNQNPLF